MNPEVFYEIELKALLSEEQYRRLYEELPQNCKLINEETIHTTRYRPGDVRLRHSDKTLEFVCKEGDPTTICRRERRIPVSSREKLDQIAYIFEVLGVEQDPPWTKHKREFEYVYNGFAYLICLQHIERFAYILEVEFLSETPDVEPHEPNLRGIIENLGLEPIDPINFREKINKYIDENKVQ